MPFYSVSYCDHYHRYMDTNDEPFSEKITGMEAVNDMPIRMWFPAQEAYI